jgi:hypothetical protein
MQIHEKAKILEFLNQQDHVEDTMALCVLVRDEMGIDLTLGQGHALFTQMDRETAA